MKRLTMNTLVINDEDLECKKKEDERTLDDITISKTNFSMFNLEKYDLIVYKGSLGIKILRARGL